MNSSTVLSYTTCDTRIVSPRLPSISALYSSLVQGVCPSICSCTSPPAPVHRTPARAVLSAVHPVLVLASLPPPSSSCHLFADSSSSLLYGARRQGDGREQPMVSEHRKEGARCYSLQQTSRAMTGLVNNSSQCVERFRHTGHQSLYGLGVYCCDFKHAVGMVPLWTARCGLQLALDHGLHRRSTKRHDMKHGNKKKNRTRYEAKCWSECGNFG